MLSGNSPGKPDLFRFDWNVLERNPLPSARQSGSLLVDPIDRNDEVAKTATGK
jgi:hypothetical protein